MGRWNRITVTPDNTEDVNNDILCNYIKRYMKKKLAILGITESLRDFQSYFGCESYEELIGEDIKENKHNTRKK